MSSQRLRLGADGETVVARHYERLGFTVVARNWRCREGEIDLIVSRDDLLVFCEVKTRRSSTYGGGAAAVGWSKQRKIRGLAARWLAEHSTQLVDVRFDVAVVNVSGQAFAVELLEAAF